MGLLTSNSVIALEQRQFQEHLCMLDKQFVRELLSLVFSRRIVFGEESSLNPTVL
jgi:hypothetical protein